jgi:broad specificity phosphatase PhoE
VGDRVIELVLIRHGPTEWNALHRLQGHTDVPLSAEGRERVQSWTLPSTLLGYDWLSSPLTRALETATLLYGKTPPIDARLKEMSWGRWEGYTVHDLRAELGEAMRENEMRALDFQPPEGESPRQVLARMRPLLRELALRRRPVVAVTHRGVMRPIYAEAAGWNMLGKPPHKLEDGFAQVFEIDDEGVSRRVLDFLPMEPRE